MENRRQHIRLTMNSDVSVGVMSGTRSNEFEEQFLPCEMLDVAWGGIRVRSTRSFQEGAILPINAQLIGFDRNFRMQAEVVWCRPDVDVPESWLAGFKLWPSNDTDLKEWRELLEEV